MNGRIVPKHLGRTLSVSALVFYRICWCIAVVVVAAAAVAVVVLGGGIRWWYGTVVMLGGMHENIISIHPPSLAVVARPLNPQVDTQQGRHEALNNRLLRTNSIAEEVGVGDDNEDSLGRSA